VEELRSYIESRRGQGVDDKQIKQELLDAGWEEEALGSFLGEARVPKPAGDHLLMSGDSLGSDNKERMESLVANRSEMEVLGRGNLSNDAGGSSALENRMGDNFQLYKPSVMIKDDLNIKNNVVVTSLDNDKNDSDFGDVNLSATYVEPKKGNRKVMFLGLGILVILLLIGGLVGGSVATVYGSWKPWGMSSELRRKLVVVMANVPFAPKTTEQVLLSALASSQEITRYNLDFSVAASVGEVGTESAKADLVMKGPIDITNASNPQFDLSMDVGVNMAGSLYKVEALAKKSTDKKIYLKLESVSDSIWNLFAYTIMGTGNGEAQGADQAKQMFDPLFKNWILYDLSDLDTGARRAMDEHNTNAEADVRAMEMFDDLINRPEVRGEFELVGKEDLYGFKAYHLAWKPSTATIQLLMREYMKSESGEEFNRRVDKDLDEFVDVVESMGLDFWFREDDFLLTKITAVMQMNLANLSDGLGGMDSWAQSLSRVSVAYSLSTEPLTDPLVVSAPDEVLTVGELMGKMNGGGGVYGNLDVDRSYNNNIDTQRRNDIYQIANSIYQFTIENNGVFPVSIPKGEANKRMLGTALGNVDLSGELVPMYMSQMPYDPVKGSPEATEYWVYLKSDGRIVLEADSVLDPSKKITVTR